MKVYREDQKTLQGRIDAVLWCVIAAFVALASSFWYVQVMQAEKYRDLSEANALRNVTVRAQRGLILDRKGRVLAENQPSHTLVLTRNELSQALPADLPLPDERGRQEGDIVQDARPLGQQLPVDAGSYGAAR